MLKGIQTRLLEVLIKFFSLVISTTQRIQARLVDIYSASGRVNSLSYQSINLLGCQEMSRIARQIGVDTHRQWGYMITAIGKGGGAYKIGLPNDRKGTIGLCFGDIRVFFFPPEGKNYYKLRAQDKLKDILAIRDFLKGYLGDHFGSIIDMLDSDKANPMMRAFWRGVFGESYPGTDHIFTIPHKTKISGRKKDGSEKKKER